MTTPTSESVPSSDAFKEALLSIRRDITPAQHKMLAAHCRAEGQKLTATQLAEAAGFPTYSAANLQYGFLGKMLGQQMGFTPSLLHDGAPVWTNVLASGESPSASQPGEHFVWTLRPELLKALLELPWGIKPRT